MSGPSPHRPPAEPLLPPGPDPADARTRWDTAVRALGGSALQGWRWGELFRRNGFAVERLRVDQPEGTGLAQVIFQHQDGICTAHLPRGPVLGRAGHAGGNATAVTHALFTAVDAACIYHHAAQLTVELDQPLPLANPAAAGFTRGIERWYPARTLWVPLLNDEVLLAQMRKSTRYEVRRGQRRGVTVVSAPADAMTLATFYGLLEDTAQRNAFPIQPRTYYAELLETFEEEAGVLFALIDRVAVAGAILVRFGAEAIYLVGASSTEDRIPGATAWLQFEAMRWARALDCTRYDLWGLPVTDPVLGATGYLSGSRGEDWNGLHHFKVGFGGEVITYPPSLVRHYPLRRPRARALGARWRSPTASPPTPTGLTGPRPRCPCSNLATASGLSRI